VTTSIPPTCALVNGVLTCDWQSSLTFQAEMPCPNVVRNPFPRAIVGRPVNFAIGGYAATDPEKSNCVCPKVPGEYEPSAEDPHSGCNETGKTIFAVRGGINWMSSDPYWDQATWTMDERDWNVGKTSDNGMDIANTRSGGRIAHTYETSSIDKPANGPGAGAQREPAYQVTVSTRWTAVAWFESQRREEKCFGIPSWNWDNRHIPGTDISHRWMGCGGAVQVTRREVSYPWTRDHTLEFKNLQRLGARVAQDPLLGNVCGLIPVPVIQSQSVLVR
jgi:hypothetical protein